jgi:hypothetical protein
LVLVTNIVVHGCFGISIRLVEKASTTGFRPFEDVNEKWRIGIVELRPVWEYETGNMKGNRE